MQWVHGQVVGLGYATKCRLLLQDPYIWAIISLYKYYPGNKIQIQFCQSENNYKKEQQQQITSLQSGDRICSAKKIGQKLTKINGIFLQGYFLLLTPISIWQIQIIDMYSYQKKVARKLKSKRLHFLCYKSYFISVPVILTTAATYLSYSLSLHVAARVRTQLKTLIEKVQRSLKLPHFLCTFFRTSKQNISS